MTQSEAEPMFPIPDVYLIRDKGESPDGPSALIGPRLVSLRRIINE